MEYREGLAPSRIVCIQIVYTSWPPLGRTTTLNVAAGPTPVELAWLTGV
jgi:hypothetical protein